jgi:hypothetical protein
MVMNELRVANSHQEETDNTQAHAADKVSKGDTTVRSGTIATDCTGNLGLRVQDSGDTQRHEETAKLAKVSSQEELADGWLVCKSHCR